LNPPQPVWDGAPRSVVPGRELFDAFNRSWYRRQPPEPARLERHVRPSIEQFAAFRRAARPVRLDGLLDEWPHRSRPSLSSLVERFGTPAPDHGDERRRLQPDVEAGIAFELSGSATTSTG
jgi:hypothetical protein